jgi:hypothetical protein
MPGPAAVIIRRARLSRFYPPLVLLAIILAIMNVRPSTDFNKRKRKPGRPRGTYELRGMSLRFALLVASGARASRALREAGYGASIKPHRLLNKRHIAAAIETFRLLTPEARQAILGSQA